MADDKVSLEIEVQNKDALDNIDKFEREAKGSTDAVQKAFGTLKTVAGAAVAVLAARELLQFFSSGIDAAIAQENAMRQLATALDQTGENSQAALDSFAAFANEMEATTKFGDDLVLSQVALAKTFGLSNDEAQKLVTTAADLAAATGQSLDAAVQQLGKTYAGTTGKLDEMVPALRGLTKEQLANGEAVRLLAERYGGAAEAEIQTFSGALLQAQNAFGNLQEAFGAIIVENEAVIAAIGLVKDILSQLETTVTGSKDELGSFVSLMAQGFATSVSIGVEATGFLIRGLEGFVTVGGLALGTISQIAAGLALFTPLSNETVEAIANFSDSIVERTAEASVQFENFNTDFDNFQRTVDAAATKVFAADRKTAQSAKTAAAARREFVRAAVGDAKELEKLAQAAQKFEAQLRQSTQSEYQNTLAKLDESLAKISEFEQKRVISSQKAAELRVIAEQNANDKIETLLQQAADKALEQAKKLAEDFKAAVTAAGTDPITFFVQKVEIDPLAMNETQKELAAGVGSVNLALQGKEGARKAISGLAGAAANALVPGLGSAVGPLVDALSQGPDQAKAMVRGFVEGIPEIITNIAEAMPAVVESLVDSLVNKGGAIKIAVAIVKAMSGVTFLKAIGKQILGGADPNAFGAKIGAKIVAGAKRLFEIDTKIRVAIIEGAKRLFQFDTRLRLTAFNAAREMALRIGNAFSDAVAKLGRELGKLFKFSWPKIELPPWLNSFTLAVSALKESPAWLERFMSAIEDLTGWSPGGGGGTGGDGWIPGGGQVYDPGEWHLTGAVGDDRSIDSRMAAGNRSGSRRAAASAQPVVVSLKLDGREIGRAMLNVNRRNERVTA